MYFLKGVPGMRLSIKIAIGAMAAMFCALSMNAATIPSGIPASYKGKPFCCDTLMGHYQQIPGVVKSVFFDSGGEGVGFHETTVGNQGGSMRLDKNHQQIQADLPVDMQYFNSYWDWTVEGMTDSTGSQTWHISWIDPGEYQRMSCHVNIAGTYSICLHEVPASTPNTTCITFNEDTTTNVYINNLHVPTAAQIHPGSEVWHTWDTFPDVGEVTLDTGLYLVKYTYVQGGFNYDWMKFTLKSGSGLALNFAVRQPHEAMALRTFLASRTLSVSFNLPEAGNTSLSIINCRGKVLNPTVRVLSEGAQTQSVPVAGISPGVYYLRLEHNGISAESRFVITR
jgi:hypothetical protein